jgi:hypothetical protein
LAKKRRYYVTEPAYYWSPFAAEIEAANRDKLTIERLAELLAAHRGGCNCARDKLAEGLRWLIYTDPAQIDLDRLGSQYAALGDAVNRLRPDAAKPKAKGPKLAAPEVEDYVSAEIERSYFDYRREVSTNIHPPDSTKSDRKRRGEAPGTIKRDWGCNTANGITPEDSDGATWIDRKTKSQKISMDIAAYELREHVARTPDEESILDCLENGMTFREIADELGISKYRVETTIQLFRRRASE